MKRPTILLLLLSSLAAAPTGSSGAEVKGFKHLLSVYADDREAMLKYPEGVACNDSSEFVVADTGNGRLVRFKYQDGRLVGGTEIRVAEMPYPVRLQLSSQGEIYALDERLRKIVRLTPQGTFSGTVEPQGMPAPAKTVPRSFKLDANNNIYLLDIAGERVVVLDPTGKFRKQIPFPKERHFFSDLAVATNGDIFLLDPVNPAIFLAGKDASEFKPLVRDLKDYVTFPTYLTTDTSGSIYIVDEHGNAVVAIGVDGVFQARRLVTGWRDGQVRHPGQICLTKGDLIFVTDSNNNKIQLFEITK